jgi:NADH dehydrogenase FAD-containing subunit
MIFPLQEINDARRIRNRILSNFELALQPGISREEGERLLHVVIVGGGPTGVEFGAELYDFIEQVKKETTSTWKFYETCEKRTPLGRAKKCHSFRGVLISGCSSH